MTKEEENYYLFLHLFSRYLLRYDMESLRDLCKDKEYVRCVLSVGFGKWFKKEAKDWIGITF